MKIMRILGLPVLAACGAAPNVERDVALAGDVCRVEFAGVTLPRELTETSGLVESRKTSGLFWTHNDGPDPVLFALNRDGTVTGRVEVRGVKLRDWEDLEAGPCDAGDCLYIADVGDNSGKRSDISIIEVPEPAPDAEEAFPSRMMQLRYPDGRHDAEALFRMPNGDLFVVTKGRKGPVTLYRAPHDSSAGSTGSANDGSSETIVLERVREIAPQPRDGLDLITSATASANGKWVAIRSYRELWFYRAEQLLGAGGAQPIVVDLTPLRELQGESVAFAQDGSVWLASESENRRQLPTWSRLTCELP